MRQQTAHIKTNWMFVHTCAPPNWQWAKRAHHMGKTSACPKLPEFLTSETNLSQKPHEQTGTADGTCQAVVPSSSVEPYKSYTQLTTCRTQNLKICSFDFSGGSRHRTTHNRTDLKSPSTSESSQMSSWGTFLLFKRCSSLLFCGGETRNNTLCTFWQKSRMIKKIMSSTLLQRETADKGLEFNWVVKIWITDSHWVFCINKHNTMWLPFWVPPLPLSSVFS